MVWLLCLWRFVDLRWLCGLSVCLGKWSWTDLSRFLVRTCELIGLSWLLLLTLVLISMQSGSGAVCVSVFVLVFDCMVVG